MMKFFKRYKNYLPILSGLLVVGCITTSLSGYVAPVYAVEVPETEAVADETAGTQTKKEKSGAEAEETETEEVVQGQGNFDLADGTYTGSANGYKGTVSVSVIIKDKSITAVNIDSTQDDDAFFSRAKKVIDQMIRTQKLDVDVVSGATYSSNGIINAVKNALTGQKDTSTPAAQSAASGNQGAATVSSVQESGEWQDGTYYGTGTGFAGPIQVKVVVSAGKMTDISIESTSDGDSYVSSASSGVISAMLNNQTTNVDTVSGATYSSVGIINAVRDALSGAGGSASNASSSNDVQETEPTIEPEVTGTIPYDDGIYYGVGDGYAGEVEVAVIIEDQTIQSVLVIETEDDEAFFGRAVSLLDEIVKKQNTEVDTVSGATFSSEGLIGAVEDALNNAQAISDGTAEKETEKPSQNKNNQTNTNKPINQNNTNQGNTEKPDANNVTEQPTETEAQTVYMDGTYDVSVVCTPDEDEDFEAYNLSMSVTIQNDQIVGITNVSGDGGSGNDSYIKRAVKGTSKITSVVDQVISLGSVEGVDAVSRATCTSNAIIEGCLQALEAARR